MIPGTIAFVYIGTTISEIGDSGGSGSSSTVRVLWCTVWWCRYLVAALGDIIRYARQILNRTLDDVREEDEEEISTSTSTLRPPRDENNQLL